MSDCECVETKCDAGIPAWVMTFADLMSLLLAFFVLLFSFSEMDKAVYKELAGSMKEAFGVQREIKVKESPRGINIIAREFSPGRPQPTVLNEVRQITTDESKLHPVFTDAADGGQENQSKEADALEGKLADSTMQNVESDETKMIADTDTLKAEDVNVESMGVEKVNSEVVEKVNNEVVEKVNNEVVEKVNSENVESIQDMPEGANATLSEEKLETIKRIQEDSELLDAALKEEIDQGLIDMKVTQEKIILRVSEKGSFTSGSAKVIEPFKVVTSKISSVFQNFNGVVVVSGHTDNVPINTYRFRSNWELSSSRAVSVIHELVKEEKLKNKRFEIAAYADTQPVDTNYTASGRANNRRVEIMMDYSKARPDEASVDKDDAAMLNHELDKELLQELIRQETEL